MIMAINHKRISSDIIDREAMANCHQLLSRRQQQQHNSSSSSGASAATTSATTTAPLSSFDRLFTCKTCRRSFTSFQALGGHSASHNHERAPRGSASSKSRTHQCSICGLQFPMGQALGGHMRKHRSSSYHHHPKEAAAAAVGSKRPRSPYPFPPTTPPPTPPLRPEPAERDHVEFMKRFKFDDGSRKDLSMSFEMDSSGLARTVLDRAKSLYIHEEEEDDDLLQLRLGPPVIRTC